MYISKNKMMEIKKSAIEGRPMIIVKKLMQGNGHPWTIT